MRTADKLLRVAGAFLKEAFDLAFSFIRPGITTRSKLNDEVSKFISSKGAVSGLALQGFPGVMGISLDKEIINGMPDNTVIDDGMLVSLDMSLLYKGVFVDKAMSFCVGKADDEKRRLCRGTEWALSAAGLVLQSGVLVRDVGLAIDTMLRNHQVYPITELLGHRIGPLPHMEPLIPNYDNKATDVLEEGWSVAVEPVSSLHMFYNVYTANTTLRCSCLSAHFEDTYIIYKDHAEVVTA